MVPYTNTAKFFGMTSDIKLYWKAHEKKKMEELCLVNIQIVAEERQVQLVSLCSVSPPILVANMVWTGERYGFVVQAYFENESVVVTQLFSMVQHSMQNTVPNVNTIWPWVRRLEETGSMHRRGTNS